MHDFMLDYAEYSRAKERIKEEFSFPDEEEGKKIQYMHLNWTTTQTKLIKLFLHSIEIERLNKEEFKDAYSTVRISQMVD